MLLDVKIDQSHMIGLQTNGGSQIVAWLLCIIILKMEAPKSNLFSLKKVEIFSQLIIGPMTFSKKNWAFNKAKCPQNVSTMKRLNQY